MKKLNTILIASLGAQLLLAFGLLVGQRSTDSHDPAEPLVAFEPAAVDRIVIVGDDDQQVTLVKQDGQWRLPDYHALPADGNKVKQALDNLADLRGGWPVADTSAARARFEVDADRFQRRITLFDGETELGQLYLGTSPGFRKIHARAAGADEVFAVAFNSYQAPADPAAWLDKQLLQPGGQISAIESSDFAVAKQEGKWRPKSGADDLSVVDEKIQALVSDLTGLRALEAADDAVAEKLAARDPDHRLKIEADGIPLEYRFYAEGEDRFVIRDGIARPFKIAKSDYERLSGYSGEQIVHRPSIQSDAKGDSTS